MFNHQKSAKLIGQTFNMSRVGGISDVYEDPQTFTGDANLDTLFDEYHITSLPNIMPRQRKKKILKKKLKTKIY